MHIINKSGNYLAIKLTIENKEFIENKDTILNIWVIFLMLEIRLLRNNTMSAYNS